jgi:hypothetical protein
VLVQGINPLIVPAANATLEHALVGMVLFQVTYHVIFRVERSLTFVARERLYKRFGAHHRFVQKARIRVAKLVVTLTQKAGSLAAAQAAWVVDVESV